MPALLTIDIDELASRTGQVLGHSSWHVITQSQVDGFADATGDHQWIHVDPIRAGAGPFGRTIAHGYLTLALVPALLDEVVAVGQVALVVNYGANRVRFPAPLPVGASVRAGVELVSVDDVTAGVQACFRVSFEVQAPDKEAAGKPACVADIVFRYYRPKAAEHRSERLQP